jgi:hypothetical protein
LDNHLPLASPDALGTIVIALGMSLSQTIRGKDPGMSGPNYFADLTARRALVFTVQVMDFQFVFVSTVPIAIER